jgi:chromosome segregation ATPase
LGAENSLPEEKDARQATE